jgi:hypothetical protein
MAAAASADEPDSAAAEAQLLLGQLGISGTADIAPADDAARWARSGAMALTGPPDRPPLLPAAPIASRLAGAAAVLERLGGPAVDGPALLAARAALRGVTRRSVPGASRIVRAEDGWIAVTLSRQDDLELVPAWLHGSDCSWDHIGTAAATRSAADLAADGQELGLAVAVVPGPRSAPDVQQRTRGLDGPWRIVRSDGPPAAGRLRVLDLSALWAGPLCAHLLALAGADVVTVDSVGRPDGSRVGDPQLFALLHRGHTFRRLDLRERRDLTALHVLVSEADVVVTSARPRALQQLDLMAPPRAGQTRVAITAYGLTGPWCNRVGYGDDCAAAGGLVVGDPPTFIADAAADPATGLYAAVAALALARTGGGLVDVALREVAHHLSRGPLRTGEREVSWTGADWVVSTSTGPVVVSPPKPPHR